MKRAVELFLEYFDVLQAESETLRNCAYRIRYQVYCEEFRFENRNQFPDAMERDEYDDQSDHCLFIHRPSNQAAGCSRLIHIDPANGLSLPFLRYCKESINYQLFNPDDYAFNEIVEFSRLSVTRQFRRRCSDQGMFYTKPVSSQSLNKKRHPFPIVPVSLFLASISLFLESGAAVGVAMMETRLSRMLHIYGLRFEQVGPVVDYHGKRAPFILRRENATCWMTKEVLELFYCIQERMRESRQQEDALSLVGS
ncbi:PEP-CTERM/exosortase system-associated acyltransferase [Marinibactrum halimedae]|uniref:PEP-CTERM/exosortase system-associated acyltransferase n=1 Tax=Marinibactrum halimedae TaxID=1444977 RepID=A0AA37T642_9GAMM|nr:PEP-CTERM/exosortase system-associated acyltransferase [Marinibactrum halimedae]MCD9459620.1 PEP-CTERM/exosortase system-associated acyltransferase [Marinibactrum halimedae]GLS25562.1 hypothetical protein GCM10007877_12760 [Marinibactrum halimedae]